MPTLPELWAEYTSSRFYKDLKPASRRHYAYLYDGIDDLQNAIGSITVSDADQLYDRIREEHGHYRAVHTIKLLRVMWQFALRRNLVSTNPFLRMSLKAIEPRTVAWNPLQVSTYVYTANALQLGSMGLLATLCYDLCQRPGDVRKAQWDQFDGTILTICQEKTGTTVQLPIGECLKSLLTPRWDCGPIIVSETTGREYGESHMKLLHNRIKIVAELPSELQLRDLRRSGATALGNAGATEDEIMSITGHRSRAVLNTYVRTSLMMAENGMMKRFGGASRISENNYVD